MSSIISEFLSSAWGLAFDVGRLPAGLTLIDEFPFSRTDLVFDKLGGPFFAGA